MPTSGMITLVSDSKNHTMSSDKICMKGEMC